MSTTTTKPASETVSDGKNISASAALPNDLVMVDLGRKSGKQIKRLRKKSEGKLADDVAATIEQLKADGVIGANAQPVVIVVERRAKKKGLFAFN